MKWDDIKIFNACMSAGSLSAAAQELEVQQSTVSRRIQALEEALGGPLFVRTSEGIVATPLAEKLASEYRAKAMRIEVLENEKADAVAMAAAAEDKADAAQKVLDHLAATEQEALEKMARLQRELDLVKQHAAMQQTKRDEARREHDAAQAQCDLLDRTLEPLVQECDKIALLYEHQAGRPLRT